MKNEHYEKKTTFHTYTVNDEKFTEIRTVISKPKDDKGLSESLKVLAYILAAIVSVSVGVSLGLKDTAPNYQVNQVRTK